MAPQDAFGQWHVAQDVARVAPADEVDEVDLLITEQRPALRGVEGRPTVWTLNAFESTMQAMELLEMTARGGDEERGQLSAGSRSQYRATSSRVARMLRSLE